MEDFPIWLKAIIYLIVGATFVYALFGFIQLILAG